MTFISPFIEDPRDAMRRQIALAVDSPIEEVRAIYIRAAEKSRDLAAGSGMPFEPSRIIKQRLLAEETDTQ